MKLLGDHSRPVEYRENGHISLSSEQRGCRSQACWGLLKAATLPRPAQGTCYVAKNDLEFLILLSPAPEWLCYHTRLCGVGDGTHGFMHAKQAPYSLSLILSLSESLSRTADTRDSESVFMLDSSSNDLCLWKCRCLLVKGHPSRVCLCFTSPHSESGSITGPSPEHPALTSPGLHTQSLHQSSLPGKGGHQSTYILILCSFPGCWCTS